MSNGTITTGPADDPVLQGNYTLRFEAKLVGDEFHIIDSSVANQIIDFNVELLSCITGSLTPSKAGPDEFYYPLDGNLVSFPMPSYDVLPTNCPYTFTIQLVKTDTNTTIPPFFTDWIQSQ